MSFARKNYAHNPNLGRFVTKVCVSCSPAAPNRTSRFSRPLKPRVEQASACYGRLRLFMMMGPREHFGGVFNLNCMFADGQRLISWPTRPNDRYRERKPTGLPKMSAATRDRQNPPK